MTNKVTELRQNSRTITIEDEGWKSLEVDIEQFDGSVSFLMEDRNGSGSVTGIMLNVTREEMERVIAFYREFIPAKEGS